MIKKSFLYLGLWVFIASCVPPTEEVITEVELNYSDKGKQKLYDLIDRQEVDSILTYANHPDPAYRYLIGTGLASIQSPEAIDSLSILLSDPIALVRANAAYALGQIGDAKAVNPLMNAFIDKDTLDVNNITNGQILESIGKTADVTLLKSLATVSTYRPSDSLLLLGQTRGIYRFALRGMTIPEGTDLMVEYATNPKFPVGVRIIAANYLARASDISIDEYKFRIAETLQTENNIYIKMALAITLKKANDQNIFSVLLTELNEAEDYRYQVNLLKAMTSYKYISAVEPNLANLGNPNLHIAKTAAEYLITNGNRSDAIIYRNFLVDSLHWEVKAKLYSALLKHLPSYYARTKNILKNEITTLIEATENDYEKAAFITALSYNFQNYTLIKDLGFAGSPVLRTAAMSGLERILESEEIASISLRNQRVIKRNISQIILEGIDTGDAGMIAIAGSIIKNPQNGMEAYITDYTMLEEALGGLSLPKEIETYNELAAALAYLKKEDYSPKNLTYNHPINWQEVNRVTDSTLVNILTSKGLITAKLNKKMAPGSVANFTELCTQGFYNNKVFHRVVPNFVIQTGCPRGDGYGSLDYSIRSDLANLYYDDEGFIGMASAGKDTEGTQWFITHSPTPHLDGRYTIFGKVISGMEVVHNIQIGDTIKEIKISNL